MRVPPLAILLVVLLAVGCVGPPDRYPAATLGLAAGVPVRVMSERLGPASPEFTMKQYQHVLPGMQAAAAKEIAELVSECS